MIANNTWTKVDLPFEQKTIDTKSVFKRKEDSSNDMPRCKAKLVAREYRQVKGIDFQETYYSVVRYASIRFLCALLAKYEFYINQMDVTAAYLHANIEDNIYLQPPKELSNSNGKV